MPSKYNVRDTSNFTTWPLQTEIEILLNGEARIGYVWVGCGNDSCRLI